MSTIHVFVENKKHINTFLVKKKKVPYLEL